MTKYDTQGAFDKLGQDPFLPPAPKKSRKGWKIAGLIVGGLIVVSAWSGATENTTTASSAPAPVDTVQVDEDLGITPEMVVDTMGSAQQNEFCTVYFQLGDYDLGLKYFTDGYGTSQDPSAEEVFDELLSRC